jgi:hypothetical protein
LCSESARLQCLIHGVDLGLENLLPHVSFKFEGRCEKLVIDTEGLLSEEDLLRFLEAVKFAQTAKVFNLSHDERLKVSVLLRKNGLNVLSIGSGPLIEFVHLGHDDANAVVLEGVAVDEALGNVVRLNEDIFDLLGRDILSL